MAAGPALSHHPLPPAPSPSHTGCPSPDVAASLVDFAIKDHFLLRLLLTRMMSVLLEAPGNGGGAGCRSPQRDVKKSRGGNKRPIPRA